MRRAPIVIAGTVVGLIAVLKFHTAPASLASPAGGTGPAAAPSAGALPVATAPGAGPGGGQTATGPAINFYYGSVSVRATVSGGRITRIAVASLNDESDPQSQSIDYQSLPVLEQEALKAQSASIQGVSGASYTSMGFEKSLQAALRSLGIT